MQIAICHTKNNNWSQQICHALAAGVEANGDEPVLVMHEADIGSLAHVDAAIVTCEAKTGKAYGIFAMRAAVASLCRHRGIHRLVIETGFIRNVRSNQRLETNEENLYWAAGWDGLKMAADYCVPQDWDDSRWKKLNLPKIPPRPKAGDNGTILVFGQVEDGVAEEGVDLWSEYEKVARVCKTKAAGKKIVFRPHPHCMSRGFSGATCKRLANLGYDPDVFHSTSLLLSQASVAITWMSNASVDALLSGVPVVCLSSINPAWKVAERDIEYCATPRIVPVERRQRQLEYLAWCQWTIAEFASGEAWKYLRRKLIEE